MREVFSANANCAKEYDVLLPISNGGAIGIMAELSRLLPSPVRMARGRLVSHETSRPRCLFAMPRPSPMLAVVASLVHQLRVTRLLDGAIFGTHRQYVFTGTLSGSGEIHCRPVLNTSRSICLHKISIKFNFSLECQTGRSRSDRAARAPDAQGSWLAVGQVIAARASDFGHAGAGVVHHREQHLNAVATPGRGVGGIQHRLDLLARQITQQRPAQLLRLSW